jgi:hypothetical protein
VGAQDPPPNVDDVLFRLCVAGPRYSAWVSTSDEGRPDNGKGTDRTDRPWRIPVAKPQRAVTKRGTPSGNQSFPRCSLLLCVPVGGVSPFHERSAQSVPLPLSGPPFVPDADASSGRDGYAGRGGRIDAQRLPPPVRHRSPDPLRRQENPPVRMRTRARSRLAPPAHVAGILTYPPNDGGRGPRSS